MMASEREATKRLRNYQEMSEDDLDQEESSDHDLATSPAGSGLSEDEEEDDSALDDDDHDVNDGASPRQ